MCADPDIDVIDAGTSPVLREKLVTAALKGGKHVVNQLPFAPSLEAAEGLVKLQREKGVTGAVAASVVGMPHLTLMKEMPWALWPRHGRRWTARASGSMRSEARGG